MKRPSSLDTSYLSESKKQHASTSIAEVQDNIVEQEEPKTPPLSSTPPQSSINLTSSPIKIENIQVGTASFAQLVEHNSFVDKTLLMQDFVESGETAMVITCPRRFGKSTNMDMIKTFLEIEVNEDGEPILKQDRQNYKLFVEQELLISQHKDFIEQYLGQYPVIFVSFKDITNTNYQDIFTKTQSAISSTFKQHEYMINVLNKRINHPTSTLDGVKASDFYNKFLSIYTSDGKNTSTSEIDNSLNFLSELLYDHFKKKVYVLVDEYDTPIDTITRRGSKDDIEKVNDLIDRVLGSVLKGNDTHLERGLMTGISTIAKNEASSKLNNVIVHRFLDKHKYVQYYGFTDQEVSCLLDTSKVTSSIKEEVKSFYNGYLATEQDLKIYNPWSIMLFLKEGGKEESIVNYWNKTGTIEEIKNLFQLEEIKSQIELLIAKEGIPVQFKEKLGISDIKILHSLLNCNAQEIRPSHIDLFFSYIFEHGYLTPVKQGDRPTPNATKNYKIPNKEIAQEFTRHAIDYYVDTYRFSRENFNNVVRALNSIVYQYNNIDKLKKAVDCFKIALHELCQSLDFSIMKSLDKGIHANESLIHTIVGYIVMQSKATKFGSEVHFNIGMKQGRADIAATYQDLGLIIELKFNESANIALEQIHEKNYNGIFYKNKTIQSILDIGINLSDQKTIEVQYELKGNTYTHSGEGILSVCDLEYLIYHESWNKYYLDGMKTILELRIKDLPVSTREKVVILTDLEYQLTQDSTGVNQILNNPLLLNLKTNTIVLIPYNIYNKHWVGLIITKDHNDSYQIKYLDSEVTSIPVQLIQDLKLVSNNLDIQINISQGNVEQQKYNNCGPEVVENFIQALTSNRLPQEQAVIYHSKLVENDLVTDLYLDDVSIEVLGSNMAPSS